MKTKLRIINDDVSNDIYVADGNIYCNSEEIKFSNYHDINEPVTSKDLTSILESSPLALINNIIDPDFRPIYNDSDIKYVKTKYSQIVCNNPSEEIKILEVDPKRFRSTSNLLGGSIDLDFVSFENSITFDLLGDEEYTSIVNLSDIKGTYGMAEICIKYSIGDNIYSYNTLIDIFGGNVIEEIEDLVVLEYINMVLHVYPKSETINECIISNCRVSYGNRI